MEPRKLSNYADYATVEDEDGKIVQIDLEFGIDDSRAIPMMEGMASEAALGMGVGIGFTERDGKLIITMEGGSNSVRATANILRAWLRGFRVALTLVENFRKK